MLLGIAVALFAAIHLVPAIPSLKQKLKARFGKAYGAGFGILSVVTLVLIVLAWRAAEAEFVYDPPEWGFAANLGLSFIAFLLLGIFLFRGRLRQILRLPLAMAVIVWATGHLLANGDSASLALFGGLLIYGVAHLALGFAQGFRPSDDVRQGHDMIALFVGVALYAAMIQVHTHVIGVPLFSIHDMSVFAN